MMRRVDLIYDDDPLFNTELSQSEYDFFQKHEAAFRRMCEEQSKGFWIRYIMTFRSFTNKYGYLKDFPEKKHLTYILDFAFILIHEKFVDAKFKDTKSFISDIVTIARNRSLATYCETRKCMNGPHSKNPFFAIETRDVFRRLFGSQNDEQSYLKALILIPLFLRFGGSVMICLRRWLDAPPMNPDDEYWTPDTTKDKKKKHRPTHRFEAVEDDLPRKALPEVPKAITEDGLRFVKGDEATEAFVAQQKRDKKKKKKRGKAKDALPLAKDGDLVALMVTVLKDGTIEYTGVKKEAASLMECSEAPPGEADATDSGRQDNTTLNEEIWNQLQDIAQNGDQEQKDALEKVMMKNLEALALADHEKRKRDDDKRYWAERKKREEERAKEAENRPKTEAELQAEEEAEQRAKEQAEQQAKEAEKQAKQEAEQRAKEAADRRAKEAERRAKEEADKRAKEEADKRAKEETDRRAKKKAEKRAKEAERRAKKEAEQQVREAEERAKKEAEEQAKEEAALVRGVKLRQCANCKQIEASLKLFKKCQKCKIQQVTEASYYCSKECQADDWVAVHKAFHKAYVQL